MKKCLIPLVPILLLVSMLVSGCGLISGGDPPAADMETSYKLIPGAQELRSFGNLVLDTTADEFLSHYDYGDIVLVEFPDGTVLSVPVCGDYNDVSAGQLLLRANTAEQTVLLATCYGTLGISLGLVEQSDDEDLFRAIPDCFPDSVTIRLREKGGYLDRIAIGRLTLSNDRAAYPALTDEDFCNFREVVCGTIGEGRLYRSSSPIDSSIGRNTYADKAMEEHRVRSVLNLTDLEKEARAYEGFDSTYYSTVNVVYHKLGLGYGTPGFNSSIAECLRFFANNEGPYLVHCLYGKDRTGFLCCILELLCGSDANDAKTDYRKSYYNLYDVINGTQYPVSDDSMTIIGTSIVNDISYALGTEDVPDDLNAEVLAYVKSIGLTDEEISRIRENLKAQ